MRYTLFLIALLSLISCKNSPSAVEEKPVDLDPFLVQDFLDSINVVKYYDNRRAIIESNGLDKYVHFESLDSWEIIEIDSTITDSIIINYQITSDYTKQSFHCSTIEFDVCLSEEHNDVKTSNSSITYFPSQNRIQLVLPASLLPTFNLANLDQNSELLIDFEYNFEGNSNGILSFEDNEKNLKINFLPNGKVEFLKLNKGNNCQLNHTIISDSTAELTASAALANCASSTISSSFSNRVDSLLNTLMPQQEYESIDMIRKIRGHTNMTEDDFDSWEMSSTETWTMLDDTYDGENFRRKIIYEANAVEKYKEIQGRTDYDPESNTRTFSSSDTLYSDTTQYNVIFILDFMNNKIVFDYPEAYYKKGFLSNNSNVPSSIDKSIDVDYKSIVPDSSLDKIYFNTSLGYYWQNFSLDWDKRNFSTGITVQIGTPHNQTSWSFGLTTDE